MQDCRKRILSQREIEILSAVARYFQVSVERLLEKGSEREIVYARYMACRALRELHQYSLIRLTELFNYNQHKVVMYGIKRIQELYPQEFVDIFINKTNEKFDYSKMARPNVRMTRDERVRKEEEKRRQRECAERELKDTSNHHREYTKVLVGSQNLLFNQNQAIKHALKDTFLLNCF